MLNKFGIQLKKYLEFNSIEIDDFAKSIGVDSITMKDIISGKVILTDNLINRISRSTGISIKYIKNIESSFRYYSFIHEYLSYHGITIHQFIENLHYKDFSKLNHFKFRDDRNEYDIAEDILRYMGVTFSNDFFC
ncbi:MAG: helix-turn-helix transcriptional regulator [Bacilli bacterium]|nr:helix-turn-helix transcriptional regulator [Bacilli bacterium]